MIGYVIDWVIHATSDGGVAVHTDMMKRQLLNQYDNVPQDVVDMVDTLVLAKGHKVVLASGCQPIYLGLAKCFWLHEKPSEHKPTV